MAVFSSRRRRGSHLSGIAPFVAEWNRVNRLALRDLDDRTAVVRYDDLVADRAVFRRLCGFLGVRGEYLFGRDPSRAYEEISETDIAALWSSTARTLERLDRAWHSKP